MPAHSRLSVPPVVVAVLTIGLTGFLAEALQARSPSQPQSRPSTRPSTQPVETIPKPPEGFEEMMAPADNPTTPEKVALGKALFFDKRLSGDGSRSCYSCHLNEHGLTDGLPTAIGAFEKRLSRSSPTLWNIGYQKELYWDGRSGSLEKQVIGAWKGGNMGADPDRAAEKLNGIPGYRSLFQRVFGGPATPENVAKAIAAFERTIYCGDTRYDRYQMGDSSALTAREQRGWELFRGKAACGTCHAGSLFTDMLYHNVGIGMDAEKPDIGRSNVTKNHDETGAFKTPTLRDISRSAPYFHDGSVKTLDEAVEIMSGGGKANKWLDRENLADRKLADAEREDLVAFLSSLECPGRLEKPELP